MLSINIKDDKNTIRSSSVKEKSLNSHLRTPAFQSCFLLNMCKLRCPSRLYSLISLGLVSIRLNFFHHFLIHQRHICTTSLVTASNKRAFNYRPGKHPGSGPRGSTSRAAASVREGGRQGGRHPAAARPEPGCGRSGRSSRAVSARSKPSHGAAAAGARLWHPSLSPTLLYTPGPTVL